MKKIIILLIVIAGITEGCKKYEDGPWFSLRSAKNRLYGEYTLTQYTVNGEDSLNLYNDSLCQNIKIYFEEANNVNRYDLYGIRNDGIFCMLNCVWDLKNNSSDFKITSSVGAAGTGPFGHSKTSEWKILRLTKNEVKMETTYNNKNYIIRIEE